MAGGSVIIHVMVVGFHHKKGCQVEYCYPPIDGSEGKKSGLDGDGLATGAVLLPEEWKHLPTLALPDGAHNFGKDTIYFHLKNSDGTGTVFGVSCYQQMDAKHLVNKTSDITRATVQKSVCVLSHVPLYGAIRAKLELITRAYFEQKDFTSTALLQETYASLTSAFNDCSALDLQAHYGLNVQDVVMMYKHRLLQLFKLMLLERKVLFFMTPVADLCNVLLSVVSLFPGMIERGLVECVGNPAKRSNSDAQPPTSLGPSSSSDSGNAAVPSGNGSTAVNPSTIVVCTSAEHELKEDISLATDQKLADAAEAAIMPTVGLVEEGFSAGDQTPGDARDCDAQSVADHSGGGIIPAERTPAALSKVTKVDAELGLSESKAPEPAASNNGFETGDGSKCCIVTPVAAGSDPLSCELENDVDWEDCDVIALEAGGSTLAVLSDEGKAPRLARPGPSVEATFGSTGNNAVGITSAAAFVPTVSPTSLKLDDAGFPLAIFTKGSLLHPYLSLAYYDILEDVHVRSFVIGASNVLFRQKRHNLDAIVEDDETRILVNDPVLKRQLQLTTADLRFAEVLVQCVGEHRMQTLSASNSAVADSVWEGSDEWLREQFKNYLTSLMASVLQDDNKILDDFNMAFVDAWKASHNYRVWRNTVVRLDGVSPRHPCHGGVGMSDVRLRLARTMQGTERGRKLNAALTVTGKAVGSALQSAKTTVSSWWSGWSTAKTTAAANAPAAGGGGMQEKH